MNPLCGENTPTFLRISAVFEKDRIRMRQTLPLSTNSLLGGSIKHMNLMENPQLQTETARITSIHQGLSQSFLRISLEIYVANRWL